MLNAAYGPYNPTAKGWVAAHEGLTYTFRVLDQRKVSTPYGERLYILTAGDAPDEAAAHATPGLLGAFIGVEHERGVSTPLPLPEHSRLAGGEEPRRCSPSSNLDPTHILGGSLNPAIPPKASSISKTMLLPYGKTLSERGSVTTCDEDFTLAFYTIATGVSLSVDCDDQAQRKIQQGACNHSTYPV